MTEILNEKGSSEPIWLDRKEYPFRSRWFILPGGRMHYVDEGEGNILLFVHGNPSWSFEYRRLIRHFAQTHRCIAIDHLGFGLSDKPEGASYLPQFHAENLRAFIEALALNAITLVVQDWGGPIGFDFAVKHPERIRGIIAFNSWFFNVQRYTVLRRFSRIVGSPVGRILCRRFSFFPKVLMKLSFGDRSRFPVDIHRHYLAPFPTSASRQGTWVFPKSIVGESAWLESIWSSSARLSMVPILLVWGMKDDAFAPLLPRWREAFSNHRIVTLEDVGHNVAEEAGERLISPIVNFLTERVL